jgi:hypothetical protein
VASGQSAMIGVYVCVQCTVYIAVGSKCKDLPRSLSPLLLISTSIILYSVRITILQYHDDEASDVCMLWDGY